MSLKTNPIHQPWPDTAWNSERFYSNNDEFFQEFLQAIDSSHTRLDLITYIFNYDDLGRGVLDHLAKAKRRGVNIRVLFDGVGSMLQGNRVAQFLEQNGIDVKIFHPLPWDIANYRRALRRGSWLGNFIFYLFKINQRQHAKLCIIDRNILWCGSQNITTDHLGNEHNGRCFHDYGSRVQGSGVAPIAEAFDDFWELRAATLGTGFFKYHWNNLTTLARREKNKLIVRKLKQARDRVWIVNPYFSPPASIIRAIKHAAAAGVDVRIIVPNKSDIDFFPLLTSTYYGELLQTNVRIYEYLPSILHAKLLIIDDFLLLGSTNFNHRSLLHDIEFDIVLSSEDAMNDAEQQFREDLTQCREIRADDLKLMGMRRLWGWFPWLLRYWL